MYERSQNYRQPVIFLYRLTRVSDGYRMIFGIGLRGQTGFRGKIGLSYGKSLKTDSLINIIKTSIEIFPKSDGMDKNETSYPGKKGIPGRCITLHDESWFELNSWRKFI